MAISLADQYFIKALDAYPFDLEESIENLNYALSYQQEHAGANCLMGRLYAEYLKEWGQAEAYFQAALACDPLHAESCLHYTALLLQLRNFTKARKLLQWAYTIKNADKARLLQLEAQLEELQKNYAAAKAHLKEAMLETLEDAHMQLLQADLKRIEMKEQMRLKYVYQ